MAEDSQPNEPVLRRRLKAAVFGLSVACPYDQGNPDDCQLCQARKLDPQERLEWVESLSVSEMQWIVTVHKECLAYRESNLPKSTNDRTH